MVHRRQLLAAGSGAIATAIAGCMNGESETSNGSGETESYEVCIEPAGCHTFESVPETFSVIPGTQEDMAMALGLQPEAHAYPDRKPYKFYDQLPGVEHDPDEILQYGEGESARTYDKEIFYEVGADVHLMDPRMLQSYSGWSDADLEEIETSVAPYLGSYIRFEFDGNEEPYYTMYELFEKIAEIFRREEQYEAWVELRDEFIADIEAGLPPEDERPSAAVFWRGISAESGQFEPAPIADKRNDAQSFRDLGFEDAFADIEPDGPVGYETLLEVEPDYLGAYNLSSMTDEEWQTEVIDPLENHSTASELEAVESGNVVRSSGQFMGPITHLFSTEALAKQVYPDEFGEWPGDSEDIPTDEQLFDRERVADIVNSDL
ncbi:ABC transporter substrate-binding protein [Halostagnicola bangensis]